MESFGFIIILILLLIMGIVFLFSFTFSERIYLKTPSKIWRFINTPIDPLAYWFFPGPLLFTITGLLFYFAIFWNVYIAIIIFLLSALINVVILAKFFPKKY